MPCLPPLFLFLVFHPGVMPIPLSELSTLFDNAVTTTVATLNACNTTHETFANHVGGAVCISQTCLRFWQAKQEEAEGAFWFIFGCFP